jgi:hypothetical protein
MRSLLSPISTIRFTCFAWRLEIIQWTADWIFNILLTSLEVKFGARWMRNITAKTTWEGCYEICPPRANDTSIKEWAVQ